MTQQPEEKADSVQAADDSLKYMRLGYTSQGRKSDRLLQVFLKEIPGDGFMPLRWKYHSLEQFMRRYGDKGMIVWAASSNSHLLIINGHRILRIWLDTERGSYVDMNDVVASFMGIHSWAPVEDIPVKNIKKSQPFTKRIKIREQYQMLHLVDAVKRAYGLDSPGFYLYR